MFSVKVVFFLISIAQLSYAFPDGADASACATMTPVHGTSTPQPSPPPFTVTTSVSSISPGQQLTVTITRTNTVTAVRGFMIQARTAAGAVVGQFLPTPGMRLMTCTPVGGSATHSVSEARASIGLTWVPPSAGFVGNIQFHVSVVQDYPTFWTHILSGNVGITA